MSEPVVSVEQGCSPKAMREFIAFPLEFYRGHSHYAPHLLGERRRFFNPSNPIFADTEAAFFLARDPSGRVSGRVSAHINRRHNDVTGEQAGFFGFFECFPDQAVATALMGRAEDWLRERGMTCCRGPFSFSTNDECGFLASGFDRDPGLMMPYNPPYYLDFIDALGYRPVKRLLAYEYAGRREIPPQLAAAASRLRRSADMTIRPFDCRRLERELLITCEIYNAAWRGNWGFVPMTAEEFRYAAHDLPWALDPAVSLVAEKAGRPIGVLFALPDFTPLLRRVRGRLLPFGWVHYLLGRHRLEGLRVMLLGVLPEFRRHGADLLLYHDFFRNAIARGYQRAEMSWILEENLAMRRPLERMGCTITKTYQIVEKAL